MQDQQPLKIFIVYAREDAEALKELRVQFIPVARSEHLEVWYDGEILPGQHWDKEIKTQLQSADIILLFISKYFFASEYIQTTEMKEALVRHEEGKSVVVPVIVRPCVWQDAFDINQFHALPAGAKPIFSSYWRDHDEAMVSVVEGVKKVVKNFRKSKQDTPLSKSSQKSNLVINFLRNCIDFSQFHDVSMPIVFDKLENNHPVKVIVSPVPKPSGELCKVEITEKGIKESSAAIHGRGVFVELVFWSEAFEYWSVYFHFHKGDTFMTANKIQTNPNNEEGLSTIWRD